MRREWFDDRRRAGSAGRQVDRTGLPPDPHKTGRSVLHGTSEQRCSLPFVGVLCAITRARAKAPTSWRVVMGLSSTPQPHRGELLLRVLLAAVLIAVALLMMIPVVLLIVV